MTARDFNFIQRLSQDVENNKNSSFHLGYARPILKDEQNDAVVTNEGKCPRRREKDIFVDDGLYSTENLFSENSLNPFLFSSDRTLEYKSKDKFCGKLVEIVIRTVKIHSDQNSSKTAIEISAVAIVFRGNIICKSKSPFNRKLHKLLVRNSDSHNLSIQVETQSGQRSLLPLPLPKRCVKEQKVDIDFAINNDSGTICPGTVTCTISLSNYGASAPSNNHNVYTYKLSSDPNDPHNSLSLLKPQIPIKQERTKYFCLLDPALIFSTESDTTKSARVQLQVAKPPDIVVTEQPAFSLLDVSIRNIFQARRPLRPSSSTRRHHTIGKTILSVTILRGVEVPVREESALIQPFVEVEWCHTVHTTSVADGPAPIWQQTMLFELPRQNGEYSVKLRLYDQHPVWGPQWLGEARIPLEYHRNYQELERWVILTPLFSPVLLFGYVQASPGQAHTRIYVLMKMEQPGNAKSIESSAVQTLLKGIQRCLSTSYQVPGLDTPNDAARLTMLLPALPTHYGPISPHQVLSIKKVDHYGRAAFLAALLEGFGMQAYVLLGSSQVSKWTAFVLTTNESGMQTLWDPETGYCYRLDDNRCSLMRVSRLVNQFGIWENLQKSILPHNLKYDVKLSKDWRPLDTVTTASNRSAQILEINITDEEKNQIKVTAAEMEEQLKEKLINWRRSDGLTTVFNRHVISVLRNFILKSEDFPKQQLDKKELKLLHRAYHIHGFVLNTRYCSTEELAEQLQATKVHLVSGPIEFALVCHVQPFVGKICSVWLAIIIIRIRE